MPVSESDIKKEVEFLREKGEIITLNGKERIILESDLVFDDNSLYLYARDRLEARQSAAEETVQPEGGRPLVAKVDESGRILRWERGFVLSYSVQKDTFPTDEQYDQVVLAMKRAVVDWQGVCGVRFEYRPEFDTFAEPADVLFVVRYHPVDSQTTLIASAFFPDYPEEERNLFIYPNYYTTSIDRVGVLRHELGHVLGFRHEHIRNEAPHGCKDESLHDAMALGEYDPISVMHYLCGGFGSKDLEITDLDEQGARMVYGAPDSECAFFT